MNTGGVCDLLREPSNQPALTTNLTLLGQHSYFRQICAFQADCPTPGRPRDTNDNSADFIFADTNGTNAGPPQKLGAPGPENLASPIKRDPAVTLIRLDSTQAAGSAPNRARDPNSDPGNNSTFGTMSIRRRLVNQSGAPVSRLRFRIIDMTTFPQQSGSGFADLRARTSPNSTVGGILEAATCGAEPGSPTPPCIVTIQGLTLEAPPAQPNGGGLNSTMTVTLGTPLAHGASLNVEFLLGIQQTGQFRFYIIVEALP